jgi:hypothetical protein
MRASLYNTLSVSFLLILLVFLFSNTAAAEKIIWVSDAQKDTLGVCFDQGWVDLLEGEGYEVQREDSTMQGIPLTSDQIDTLESADLIIVSRATNSGVYNDPAGWNGIAKPLLLTSAYISRGVGGGSRWQWLNTDLLLGDGNSGAPPMRVEQPDHPIFAGVELDENNEIEVLDGSVGSGHTSLNNTQDWGEGELLAVTADLETVWIVYWQLGSNFNFDTDQYANEKRLLFACGTRESTEAPANPAHGVGMYNLTPAGEKMFLNAVKFMLGIVDAVPDVPSTIPGEYELAQNYPNPFNPNTTISFSIPKAEQVQLQVFNLIGELVATLADADFQAGTHRINWSGVDINGHRVTSGIYFYRLQTKSQSLMRKMILVQ